MTAAEAKKYARNKTLKATGAILGILILFLLLSETSGDFANGILFFIDAVMNIHALVLLAILFGLTYFFGGRAGEEIIIKKKNFILVSIKYVLIISMAISAYAIFIGVLRDEAFSRAGFTEKIYVYFFPLFLKTAICLLMAWLWAANNMRSKN